MCCRRNAGRIGELPYGEAGSPRTAYAAISARLRSPSFARMLPTWCSTVLRLMNSRWEISGLDSPSPSSSHHLELPLGEQLTRRSWRRDLLPELTQQRARGVDVSGRLERLEGAQRRSRLRHRELGVAGSRQALASSSRHRDASNGRPAWVNPSKASRSQALRVADSRAPLRQRHHRVRVRRGVRLGARLELPRSSGAGPRRRPAARRPARRAAGCTSCCAGSTFCTARCRRSRASAALAAGQVQRRPDPACASGSSRPSSRLAASSYRPCLTRRSASRIRAPALSVRRPSAHSRTASVSATSASGQRPAAVRMPP